MTKNHMKNDKSRIKNDNNHMNNYKNHTTNYKNNTTSVKTIHKLSKNIYTNYLLKKVVKFYKNLGK